MRKYLDLIYLSTGIISCMSLVFILVLMLIVSGGRNVAFNIAGADDLVGFSVAAIGSLGLAYTFKAGEIIRVHLLLDTLSRSRRRVLEIAALGVAAVMVGFFAWHAARMAYSSWRFGATASGVMAAPIWPAQAVFAFGICVFFISIADELIRVCAGRDPSHQTSSGASFEEAALRGEGRI